MTAVPWAFVPAMLVPICLLLHVVIASKLRATAQAGRLAVA